MAPKMVGAVSFAGFPEVGSTCREYVSSTPIRSTASEVVTMTSRLFTMGPGSVEGDPSPYAKAVPLALAMAASRTGLEKLCGANEKTKECEDSRP